MTSNILFKPSSEQQIIIDTIKRGKNVAVNAVAGSGKTTTILGIAEQIRDKKILQITYNRALKLEVEKKAKQYKLTNLKVLTFHGLACSYYDYTSYTDDRIQEIIKQNRPLNKPISAIDIEIIIIDEIQDMTALYFELIHKFMYDIQRKVILGIMGDNFQGIYGFKGADERFLTLGERIFPNHMDMVKLSLTTSYRLTQPMADFINFVMIGGGQRIKSIKPGPPVSYIQYKYDKLVDYLYKLIIFEMKKNGYLEEDIFILSGTLRNQRLKDLENKLVSKGLLCFVPISEDAKLDERLIKDKIVFTTFHQSKGRERKLCIVFGFDTSYYEMFKDKTSSLKICPNLLYVATSRASSKLIIIEHIDLKQALPFLKMRHNEMKQCKFIDMNTDEELKDHKNINSFSEYIHKEEDFQHNKSVCDLVKFLDEKTLSTLSELCNRVFKTISIPKLQTTAIIPNDIKTGPHTFEQVCDINGIAIPAMLFSASIEYRQVNYLWNYLVKSFLINTTRIKQTSFIMEYINKLRQTGLKTIEDWLLLANIYKSATEGYNYKLKQITNYEWLSKEMICKCHDNIDRYIDRKSGRQLNFEVELGNYHDEKGLYFAFKHPLYGIVNIRGRVDCMTPDTIWELKCVELLNVENMLQVIIYAWIWREILHSEELKNNAKTKQKISNSIGISNEEYFRNRAFKLMNFRTGEIRELDISSHYIDEIVKILLDAKLRIREILTDEQFIEECIMRVAKYSQQNNHFNINTLDYVTNDGYDSNSDSNSENVELDF
jgi:hypothetical protein